MAECTECHKVYCLDDLADLAPVGPQVRPLRAEIVLPPGATSRGEKTVSRRDEPWM